MKKENYFEMYKKWKLSEKNNEIQNKMEYKRMMYIEKNRETMIDNILAQLEYYSVQENIDELIFTSPSALIEVFRSHVINLSINLKYWEVLEVFELCQDLKMLIELKIKICQYLYKRLFENFSNEDDKQIEMMEIFNLQGVVWEIINEKWDTENNKIKK